MRIIADQRPRAARVRRAGLATLGLLTACARSPHDAPIPAALRPPSGLTAAAPLEPTDGSLWTPRRRGSLWADTTARDLYDIVFINVRETSTASHTADTELERESTVRYGIPNLLGLENEWNTISDDDPTDGVDPSNLVNADTQNDFEGEAETNRRGRLDARISAQVVEVFPNGNLRVYGSQVVAVNNENQLLTVEGIARPEDIRADNSVDSFLLAEARIDYTGRGALSDLQRPGWGARVLHWVWPF